jgi:hypothetical protein
MPLKSDFKPQYEQVFELANPNFSAYVDDFMRAYYHSFTHFHIFFIKVKKYIVYETSFILFIQPQFFFYLDYYTKSTV